eukprot:scaffold2491_cov127-Skeletonema_marinoi.AAC.3
MSRSPRKRRVCTSESLELYPRGSERSASCQNSPLSIFHYYNQAKTKKSTGQPSSSNNKRAKHEEPTLTEDEQRVVMIQFNKENEADTKTADALLKEYLKSMQVGAHCN